MKFESVSLNIIYIYMGSLTCPISKCIAVILTATSFYTIQVRSLNVSPGNIRQAARPEALRHSCVLMSGFTHHPAPRQTHVHICSRSQVVIFTLRSQGEAACNRLHLDVPKYVTSQLVFFPPVCVFSSLAHMNSLSRAHSKCSWNVWCGLSVARVSPAPFTRKSSWFRICFYSPVCLELYYKLGRKNLSQTCHVFPERRM